MGSDQTLLKYNDVTNHLVGCLHCCSNDAWSHKRQIVEVIYYSARKHVICTNTVKGAPYKESS